ncbi:MAG: tRNA 2-thiocytidine(32) synthetase TtcA [Lachnospiraceae bacterium]|nr:tRNA 2-thiocytidine(32) synthetase TtcA [Lachnospiraceae bacterium]
MKIQKLYSLTRQAIDAYAMIEEGDKIAVGISGGKDSLTLLQIMAGLQKFYPKKFELMAITCDVGFEGMDFRPVASWCESLGIAYETVKTNIAEIVFEHNQDERPCSLCAKLRKGAMYDRLNELGFHKIAYAHHKDDFIETAFMSLIFEGRFYSFPPVTELDRSGITVIRPMMYVPERSVATFARENALPVVHNVCPVDGSTKRAYAKGLVKQLSEENRGVKDRLMHAIEEAHFEDWPVKVVK